ncbi:malate synthase G [Microbacterium sp. HA-8]|uniref:malate synthase G n=1 Tax=Microbacterium sp. HA-8 TaxID=3234200 RepID=UPI0038F6BAB9
MTEYDDIAGIRVAPELRTFIEHEALPHSSLTPRAFWEGVATLAAEFGPRTRALLAERDRLQSEVDDWHRAHPGPIEDPAAYRWFLRRIGYLVDAPATDPIVTTTGVDDEIAVLAGPQLVVPVTNARYALNAVNARWGSLYDALYGTDAIPGAADGPGYDGARGALVVEWVRDLLDRAVPLASGSHRDTVRYRVVRGRLEASLLDGAHAGLADAGALRGYIGDPDRPDAVLLRHHGLHIDIRFDPQSIVGAADPAGIADVVLESALSTIVDFEDSVATVDASDKVAAYRNWLGLNRGDLSERLAKGGREITRTLADDRHYTAPDGTGLTVPGRAVMFVRNVGHLMTTDAVRDAGGEEIGEGLLDAIVTSLCALPGRDEANPRRNGDRGSIYIVKPKMHGPAEAALARDILIAVERMLELPVGTIKIGVMDEERRTSVNLEAVIAEVADRIVFINTGFLDRSGDEIHTAMLAGPVVPKAQLKTQVWIAAYEDRNVDVGLATGLVGHGQIGKGMWAMPDLMADMLAQKAAHPRSGASTAWVPSPTAATLHAVHYHEVDVAARQAEISTRPRASLDRVLTPPVGDPAAWSAEERRREVENNVQSLLGYVVRWVDLGVGCSKVPDISDVGLMEDRATLRISSQLLANWLHHGVVEADVVRESMRRMAAVVDAQNAADPAYRPMCDDLEGSIAFAAATELVFEGARQPNGYTEPILHRRRREAKAAASVACV